MKAIRTTSRIGIDQCRLQIVCAEKPVERTNRPLRPFLAAIRAQCGKTRRNRRGCLDGLLIERVRFAANPAEAFGADRSEIPR